MMVGLLVWTSADAQSIKQVDLQRLAGGSVREFSLEGLYTFAELAVSQRTIFAADPRESKIYKFSLSGELLGSIGQKGQGPGELVSPQRMAFSGGYLLVLDAPARISVFDRDGSFDRAYPTPGILMANALHSFPDGSTLVVGLRMKHGRISQGTLLHFYGPDGRLLLDAMPTSGRLDRHGVEMIIGGDCDIDDSQVLWCVDASVYKIRSFDNSGRPTGGFSIDAPAYSPLESDMPGISTEAFEDWIRSWDTVHSVFSVSQDLLIVERSNDGDSWICDVIDSTSGDILGSYETGLTLQFVDKGTGLLYFLKGPTGDSFVTLLEVSLADLLAF